MLSGLLGRDPWKPDEAYSFGLVYHILQSGDWVVPTLAQEPFMEKPPLFYITAALFAKGFGWLLPLHDAARLANAFYLGLAFLFIGLAGEELYGRDKEQAGSSGWISVLALLGCVGLLEPRAFPDHRYRPSGRLRRRPVRTGACPAAVGVGRGLAAAQV